MLNKIEIFNLQGARKSNELAESKLNEGQIDNLEKCEFIKGKCKSE